MPRTRKTPGNVAATLAPEHIQELNRLSPELGSKLQTILTSLKTGVQASHGLKGPAIIAEQKGKSVSGKTDPGIDLQGGRIADLGDPIDDTDAANLQTVRRYATPQSVFDNLTQAKPTPPACQSPRLKPLSSTPITGGITNMASIVRGGYFYIHGDPIVGGGPQYKLEVWDINNTAAPRLVGEFLSGITAPTGSAPHICSQGRHLFVGDTATDEIIVWDIYDAAHPVAIKPFTGVSSGDLNVLVASGRYLYTGSQNVITRYDISVPSDIERTGPGVLIVTPTLSFSAAYKAMDIVDGFLYAGGAGPGLLDIFAIYDSANNVQVSTLSLPNSISSVSVSGSYAYLSDINGSAYVVDVSDPAHPSLKATFTASGQIGTSSTFIDGTNLYVGDQHGIFLFDVTTPTTPLLVGSDPAGCVDRLYQQGRNLITLQGNTPNLAIYRVGGFFCNDIGTNALWAENTVTDTLKGREADFLGEVTVGSLTTQRGIMGHISNRDPLNSDIPDGFFMVWVNRNAGTVKLVYNDAGTIRSSAPLT